MAPSAKFGPVDARRPFLYHWDNEAMRKKSSSQRVVVRNRYARAEYKSLEEAAASLSSIGAMSRDEVMSLLRDRVGYINGFAVSYPDDSTDNGVVYSVGSYD